MTRNRNKPKDPFTGVPKRDAFIVLPYLGLQSKFITKQLKSVSTSSTVVLTKNNFRNTHHINCSFPYKDRLNRSLKAVYEASCWDCDDFYIGKTKSGLHDRKTEHFKVLTNSCQS